MSNIQKPQIVRQRLSNCLGEMSNSSKESKSALHASLEAKKDQSYYYAHLPRNTNEARAPDPIHQALHTEEISRAPLVESISRYQFMDTTEYAKVFIPLDNVGDLPEASISSHFDKDSFTVSIQGYKPGFVLRLFINNLEGEIHSEECKIMQKPNKLAVLLKKAKDDAGKCFPWRNLKK